MRGDSWCDSFFLLHAKRFCEAVMQCLIHDRQMGKHALANGYSLNF